MVQAQPDAAETTRRRLQEDLRASIKGRARFEAAVLRVLIAAIDNAGAVPLSVVATTQSSEIERRHLSAQDVQAILRREYEIRHAAAKELAAVGRRAEAESAGREMQIVRRYLEGEVNPK